jgi:hypothetical protein
MASSESSYTPQSMNTGQMITTLTRIWKSPQKLVAPWPAIVHQEMQTQTTFVGSLNDFRLFR